MGKAANTQTGLNADDVWDKQTSIILLFYEKLEQVGKRETEVEVNEVVFYCICGFWL